MAAYNKISYIYISCVTKGFVFVHAFFWWKKTYLQFATLYKNTHTIRSTGSTMYVAHLLYSVPVQTTRTPCSRGLHISTIFIGQREM